MSTLNKELASSLSSRCDKAILNDRERLFITTTVTIITFALA